jgi:hypothetical protein
MAVKAKSQMDRNEKLKTDRSLWDGFYRDVIDYQRMGKQSTDEYRVPGTRTHKHYDSTAPHASKTLALIMADTLTPKAIRWFGFKIPEASPFSYLNDDQDAIRWFEDVGQSVSFALNQSNFYVVINEIYEDFNSFATICLYIEEARQKRKEFNGLNFRALPISSYVFAENEMGFVDTLFREYDLSARQILQRFPGAKIPDVVQKSMKQSPDDMFELLRVVGPADELESKVAKKFPFASADIFKDQSLVLEEQGYEDFPYMVGRWDKASGEIRGRGPAMIAMDDIKSLNQLRKLELVGLEKAVNPSILTGEEGFIGNVKLGGNSIVYSRDPQNVRLLPTELRLDLSSLKANDLKQSIRDIYLTDQLNLPNNSRMTAEEIATRRSEMERLLGPTISRFETEVLGPMLERVVGIMMRTNALPEMPASLQEVKQHASLEIEYVGQLARAQRMTEIQSMQNWLSMLTQWAEINPDVLQIPDLPAMARLAAPILGVPKRGIRGSTETQEKIDEIKTQQDAQAKQMQMAQTAESAGKAAPALKVLQDGAANLSDEEKQQLAQQFAGAAG